MCGGGLDNEPWEFWIALRAALFGVASGVSTSLDHHVHQPALGSFYYVREILDVTIWVERRYTGVPVRVIERGAACPA